jgi:hypothetical protein
VAALDELVHGVAGGHEEIAVDRECRTGDEGRPVFVRQSARKEGPDAGVGVERFAGCRWATTREQASRLILVSC